MKLDMLVLPSALGVALKESMPGVQEGRVHDKLQCIGLRCSWNRIP